MLQLEMFLFHGLLIVFYWIIKFLISKKLNIQYAFLSMYTIHVYQYFIYVYLPIDTKVFVGNTADAHTTVF